MRYTTASILVGILVLGPTAQAGAQDPDAYAVEDSLETRVWLDRGAEPVVEPGDEVRVYYRTSDDAYAAIFRVDTDGRISLLYPQHPDVDPYVIGGRDYRLVFPDSPRWRVREDPGVGYFFMVASRYPLDFSVLGYDADEGWDLGGIGETVYEDPYVAIDDYVAALIPEWDVTPYALDFLEYSVGEEHDYPRFICYDCHGFRSYARWDPYAHACSSYQVVVWNDPYFIPRFRYVGNRVVFARPIGPRPRYGFTARVVGSTRGPIIRTRAAPPRRTPVFKESPRGRGSYVTPRRSTVVSPGARSAPAARARPSARLGAPAARAPDRRGAVTRAPGAARGQSPGATRRQPPAVDRQPSGAARRPPPSVGRSRPPGAVRGGPPAATRDRPPIATRGRPPTATRGGPPSATRGRPPAATPARPPREVRPAPGGSATSRERPTLQRRTPPPPPRARSAPRRPGGNAARPPRAGPPRSGDAAPSRPRARPGSGPPRARPGGSPPRARSSPAPGRPSARPAPRPPRAGPPRSGRPGGAVRPGGSSRRRGGASSSRPPGG